MLNNYPVNIHLLSIWYGPSPPEWLNYYIDRINAQTIPIKWTCVGNIEHENSEKVSFVQLEFEDLKARISHLTDLPCQKMSAYSMCDIRPAFGELFVDILKDSDWWGWCDLDIVFGDMSNFLLPGMFGSYDLITDSSRIVNGPFTILRNDAKVNQTYKGQVFNLMTLYHGYTGFDEVEFTEIAKSKLRCCFPFGWHKHDRQVASPLLLSDGRLMSDNNEIMVYHFASQKIWPL